MTDEAPRIIRDEPGEELSRDPASTFLTQPGGLGPAFSDFVLYGVFNGAFARGPNFPANNIDPWNSAGSNFMPNWRFVQSSNTNITAKQARDTASPSGSNIRFTYVSGAAADEAMVEQIVNIGGARDRVLSFALRPSFINNGATTFTGWAEVAYLTIGGALTGAAVAASSTVAAGVTYNAYSELAAPSTSAYYLRVRVGTRRGATAISATGSLDIASVRLERTLGRVRFPEETSPGTYAAGNITQSSGNAFVRTPAGDFLVMKQGDVTGWLWFSNSDKSIRLGDGLTVFDVRLTRTSPGVLGIAAGLVITNVITPTALSAATDNWDPTGLATAAIIRASSDANRNLSGIVAQEDGRLIRLYNVGAFNISLLNDATSTAANRFLCPNAATLTLNPQDSAELWYDGTSDRWRVLGA